MEFNTLYTEVESKIIKAEKMAQRFTGATESVDEFRRRIEKESKQQQSINKALFELKRQQDAEQDRIRRGLSPQQAQFEQQQEREARKLQRKEFQAKRGALNRYHSEQMKYLDDAYTNPNDANYENTMVHRQQEVLDKKRGSVELDEEERRNITHPLSDDEFKGSDVNSVDTINSETDTAASTNEHETKKLVNNEQLKRRHTMSKIKERKDLRTEQIELSEEEQKWFRKHTNFLYSSDDLEYIFNKTFKLTATDFDKIARVEYNPLFPRAKFHKELNRDVLVDKRDKMGHIRHGLTQQATERQLQKEREQRHHRRMSTLNTRRLSSVTRSNLNSSGNLDEDVLLETDERDVGVFHARMNGVCTFTVYDNKVHRTPLQKAKFKTNVQTNKIKGVRITISRYLDRMPQREIANCTIDLDVYMQDCLQHVFNMRGVNIFEEEEAQQYDPERKDDEGEEGESDKEKALKYKHKQDHLLYMSKRLTRRQQPNQEQRIIVLCPQHKIHIQHGVWSRAASLCGNLALGSMLNYLYTGQSLNKQAKQPAHQIWKTKSFDYVIAEPNCMAYNQATLETGPEDLEFDEDNVYTTAYPRMPGHQTSSFKHFEHLWDRYLVHRTQARFFWVGHMEGCQDIKHLLTVRPTAAERTAGIVFMDYFIDDVESDLSPSTMIKEASSKPPEGIANPYLPKFFNGTTNDWLIRPINISTEKYPSRSNYDWEKEERLNPMNRDELTRAPVLLFYSVNVNWRFTPALSMYAVNKYILHRGMMDNGVWWLPQEEQNTYIQSRQRERDHEDMQNNMFRAMDLRRMRNSFSRKANNKRSSVLSRLSGVSGKDLNAGGLDLTTPVQSIPNLMDVADEPETAGMQTGLMQHQLDDADAAFPAPGFNDDLDYGMNPEVARLMKRASSIATGATAQQQRQDDHRIPAAHEQGPAAGRRNQNSQNLPVYSKLPPSLLTIDAIKNKMKMQRQHELELKRLQEEALERQLRELEEAEKAAAEEGSDEEDGDGKKGKKKKKKKGKKDKDKKKKKDKDKKKKGKKKKGGDDDEDDEEDGKKKKKGKKKKDKKDKKKKKGKKKKGSDDDED